MHQKFVKKLLRTRLVRFKRLTFWNKIGAIGACASILAIPLAISPFMFEKDQPQVSTVTNNNAGDMRADGSNTQLQGVAGDVTIINHVPVTEQPDESYVTRGQVRTTDGTIPRQLQVSLKSPNTLLRTEYDPATETFDIRYIQEGRSTSSHVSIDLMSPTCHPYSLEVPVNESMSDPCILESKGDVRIERLRKIENDNEYGGDYECIVVNSTTETFWISDFLLLGLGTSNSVCNPNPELTMDYRISVKWSDSTDADSETHYGEATTQYCDGFLCLRVPVFVEIPKESRTHYSFSLSDLRIRRIGYGMYAARDDRGTVVSTLQLLSKEDRTEAEEKISKIIGRAFDANRAYSFGEPKYTFQQAQDDIAKTISQYKVTKNGERLIQLRQAHKDLIAKLLEETRISERQSLRALLVENQREIAKAEMELSPFIQVPFQRLLEGQPMPFPSWSRLNFTFVLHSGEFIHERIARDSFPGHMVDELLVAARGLGVETGLDSLQSGLDSLHIPPSGTDADRQRRDRIEFSDSNHQ